MRQFSVLVLVITARVTRKIRVGIKGCILCGASFHCLAPGRIYHLNHCFAYIKIGSDWQAWGLWRNRTKGRPGRLNIPLHSLSVEGKRTFASKAFDR